MFIAVFCFLTCAHYGTCLTPRDASVRPDSMLLQALLTLRNKTTFAFAFFYGCGFIVLGSVFPVSVVH